MKNTDQENRSTSALDRDSGQLLADLGTDLFVLGLQLEAGHLELPPCDTFQQRVLGLFEALDTKATQAGVAQGDIAEARYALAAYVDEKIQYSAWEGKPEWAQSPLQAQLFDEAQAGKHFFVRLAELRSRRAPVLRVYYTCLLLGFLGEYRMRDVAEQQRLIDDLGREISPGGAKKLSPHGERPDQSRIRDRRALSWPLALLALGVAASVVVVLYALLAWERVDAVELLQRMVRR